MGSLSRVEEVSLTPLGKALVTQGHHYRQEWTREVPLEVVNEERLQRFGAVGEKGAGRICDLQILCDGGSICQNDGAVFVADPVHDDWKCVDRPPIRPSRGVWRANGSHRAVDFWKIDPYGSVWQSFVV